MTTPLWTVMMWHFYPRPPRGGRLHALSIYLSLLLDFYPRPPRGGRLSGSSSSCRPIFISIHALREEGDHGFFVKYVKPYVFLSTPSARRATRRFYDHRIGDENFYPRPPRGGRRGWMNFQRIQITFLSTPSARRATVCTKPCSAWVGISIHALREEGDLCGQKVEQAAERFLSTPSARRATPDRRTCASVPDHFYPRPPRGGRRRCCCPDFYWCSIFLSTPSARRATGYVLQRVIFTGISIHALREEGDIIVRCGASAGRHFYPRPPRGGRHTSRSA